MLPFRTVSQKEEEHKEQFTIMALRRTITEGVKKSVGGCDFDRRLSVKPGMKQQLPCRLLLGLKPNVVV